MRCDVKKFIFVGLTDDKEAFFKRAQELGVIHFIHANSSRKIIAESDEIAKLGQAIKILRGLPVIDQEEIEEQRDAREIAEKVIHLDHSLEALLEKRRTLNLEMARIQIFGNFSPEDVAYIEQQGNYKIKFYCGKKHDDEELPEDFIYVGSNHDLDYFVAISKKIMHYPGMMEIVIENSAGQIGQLLKSLEKETHETEHVLKEHAAYNSFLHQALIHSLNQHHLENAKGLASPLLDQGNLFVVQGWVPSHKKDQLQLLADEMHIHYEEVGTDASEIAPTYLENSGTARIGEDLVHVYDIPSSTDKDPSLWVLVFFSLFFAMIIGDGGYGLVLLLIALYLRYKQPGLQGLKKRMLSLFTILAFSCIAWGALSTSFFGLTISPDNPVRKISLVSWLVEKKAEYHLKHHDEVFHEWLHQYPQLEGVKNAKEFLMTAVSTDKHGAVVYEAYNKFSDNIMMEMALLIGVLHVILSMGRYIGRNWSHAGWILFLIGAYLCIPCFLGTVSMTDFVLGIDRDFALNNGLYLVYGGMALAVGIALLKHRLMGLIEATNIIQIFGDVLSYLRLYALGLAGSILSGTMMDLAASVPFAIGVVIIVCGHAVNLVLGVMGGVIHGLRLNFLEWYHYSFEGGPPLFDPLRKLKME
jgi:V/A-type H+/Na+-transporting ATPase subunit I